MTPNPIDIKIKGIEIHGLQWGNPDGPKVLALHGWLDNAETFSSLAPALTQCNVIAVDLPGHGLSGHWPAHQHYHVWAGVEDIEHILDALGWEQCHILAHSMGAAMATLYAGTFPDRLISLTLVEAIGPASGDTETAPERLAKAILSMKAHNFEQATKPSSDIFVQARLNGSLKLKPESAKKIVERGLSKSEEGYAWINDKRLRYSSMMRLTEDLIASFISAIKCPVLGVFADGGLFTEETIQQRWQHLTCEHTLHWFKGSHHLHIDGDIDEISCVVSEFIAQHS
ncbi:alpha/beta fold hydrolase [Oceaniserpentilla sp. 4NH20-0058]|uniref:alpha/beta fold hydrolase n=1 Tax=Oceaniserpentilla sp. 4NH20-0058 TaxID=3127660 RepID=UPI0031092C0C